jgi:hypothetical protein
MKLAENASNYPQSELWNIQTLAQTQFLPISDVMLPQ